MAVDLVIKNGTVVDGTGAPKFIGDIAVDKGLIVEVGKISEQGRETVDAEGLTVTPGFIDPHTHYDAQISWDTLLNSSSEHGVTTALMGNCGVGVAPCRPEHREMVMQDLINVEGMSEKVLKAGIRWEWETFNDYISTVDRHPSAVNRAFLIALSPLRTYVMGTEASERAATPEETSKIADLLSQAMKAGASGFSSTNNRSHVGYQGKAFAARMTSHDEYRACCKVLKDEGRGVIQIALTNRFASIADDELELLDLLLTESGRRVSWISLLNDPNKPNGCREVLDKAGPLLARGAAPQMLLRSMLREFTLQKPYPFLEINVAASRIFNRSLEEQKQAYRDPAFRNAFRAELAEGRRFTGHPPKVIVCKVDSPALRKYDTRLIGEIAADRGADPIDTLFDVALEDNLGTLFAYERGNNDQKQIADMLNDSRAMIGLADGGAHVDMLYEAGYPTYLLSHWVRDRKVLSIEKAVQRMTSEPADFFGFKDRGRIKSGQAADLVVLDADRVGSPERGAFIYDLPTGAGRLHAKAQGIHRIMVNGQTTYLDGEPTGARPGVRIQSK
jgi:N-acyl-D-amino-acid deacylase